MTKDEKPFHSFDTNLNTFLTFSILRTSLLRLLILRFCQGMLKGEQLLHQLVAVRFAFGTVVFCVGAGTWTWLNHKQTVLGVGNAA